MAIEKQFKPATDATPIEAAYFRIVETNFNHADEEGRIGVAVYRSREDREAGCIPVMAFGYPISKQSQPEQRDQLGNVVRPAIPSYAELSAALVKDVQTPGKVDLFDAMKALCYTFISQQPELAGGKAV